MDTIVVGGATPALQRRRSYSLEEKRQLVAESHEPGASVSLVARRHDINANLLFTWRRQLRAPMPAAPLELIPIEIVGTAPSAMAVPTSAGEAEPPGLIEIILVGGVRVRVDAKVSEAALKRVLSALRAAA